MTPNEMAQELVYDMQMELPKRVGFDTAKSCALVAVTYLINSNPHFNPHSNPFNTSVQSTMKYWQDVKMEIKNLNN